MRLRRIPRTKPGNPLVPILSAWKSASPSGVCRRSSGPTQPIREEGKTVIVFDNGAVLRSTQNLPVGQTVILSNPTDVKWFAESWAGATSEHKGIRRSRIHRTGKRFLAHSKDADPLRLQVRPRSLRCSSGNRRTATCACPPRAAAPSRHPRSRQRVLGNGPKFEDIPGLLSLPAPAAAREPKTQSMRPRPGEERPRTFRLQPFRCCSTHFAGKLASAGPELPRRSPRSGNEGSVPDLPHLRAVARFPEQRLDGLRAARFLIRRIRRDACP